MRKPVIFAYAKTKIQSPCFRYIDSTIPQTIFCGSTAQFVLDLIGNSKDRFSRDKAQMFMVLSVI